MPSKSTSHSKLPRIACRVEDDCDDLDLKLSKGWLRIAFAGVFAGQGMVFSLALNMTPPIYGSTAYWILHGGLIFSALVVMVFLAGPLFASTLGMLQRRRVSIEGLFTVSLLGAFIGSTVGSITGKGDVFYEIVAIVIAIYTFGRILSERSQTKMRLESAILREQFNQANICTVHGEWKPRPLSEVKVGTKVSVNPGDAITVDGHITSGVGYIQETALTGEPLPIVRREGDLVRAGTYSIDSRFEIETLHSIGNRELDKILDTVESSDGQSSDLQTQADELVQKFLPLVVSVALTTGIFWGIAGTWVDAVLNSMSVLLVACPCALGLATPVAIAQGLFRLSQLGLVSRDGALIDVLARTRHIFFDKTGTLSESNLRVSEIWIANNLPMSKNRLLTTVLCVEASIHHPVAQSIRRYLESICEVEQTCKIKELRLIPGQGVECMLNDLRVTIGERSLSLPSHDFSKVDAQLHCKAGKRVYAWIADQLVACFVLEESLREGVDSVWQQLDEQGVTASILTGDPDPKITFPQEVSLNYGLSSEQKVRYVLKSIKAGEDPLFVGDGINDTAAMSAARGSIAMNSGVGLATSLAMGCLSTGRIEAIPKAIVLSKKIHTQIRSNLIYAVAYNIIGMSLASMGLLNPVFAAMLMLISSFFVSIRAIRGPLL